MWSSQPSMGKTTFMLIYVLDVTYWCRSFEQDEPDLEAKQKRRGPQVAGAEGGQGNACPEVLIKSSYMVCTV